MVLSVVLDGVAISGQTPASLNKLLKYRAVEKALQMSTTGCSSSTVCMQTCGACVISLAKSKVSSSKERVLRVKENLRWLSLQDRQTDKLAMRALVSLLLFQELVDDVVETMSR